MVSGIDRAEVVRLIKAENAQIVDVLPEPEYTEAHIPGAINLPLRRLTADTAVVLSFDRRVVVYCHDGL